MNRTRGGSRLLALAAALWLMEAAAGPASACPDHPALVVGESLTFDISWVGIPAGRATLVVEQRTEVGGREILRLVSTAESNRVIDGFYKVRDRVESLFDCVAQHSLSFRMRTREGKRKREREAAFDMSRREAVLTEQGQESRRFPLTEPVQDPLSSLYVVRTRPLVIGQSVLLAAFEGGKRYDLEVKVLRKERINVPAGKFDTIVVKPLLRSEGIFQHKGDVVVWLTDDARRMPVRMESEIKIGSVLAELTWYDVRKQP